jgi:hypothetical protein
MAAALMSAFVSPPMPADLEAMPFLQKPFHLDEFLHTVRMVLRNDPPGTCDLSTGLPSQS